VKTMITSVNTKEARMRIAALIADGPFGASGQSDEMQQMKRDQFHRFVVDTVRPHANEWHLQDWLIPMELIELWAELGVFGLTVPEESGGLGLGKVAMCVVTEELSRGYIGVGSLGTRSEIAAELIRLAGTEAQRAEWLPRIASGEVLPTAVFTEPNTGSDLASLSTRAVKDGDTYKITGNKTWITHAARADVMTLLARTGDPKDGYRGLSMFIAPKPRGTDDDPFPAEGMSGGEIGVLGYRGMKEYEIAFDGFEVPADGLLGGAEGEGFKQLMVTFEAARIQTAARAVGVAQNAMELGLAYAQERIQFGKPLAAFPRVAGKLAWMAVETQIARQLSYFAAREKDSDRRCDIEAGMAKLLAARVAWANADNALQIHGGNGYAQEYEISRVLCDARILNIFEGAAEIQAQVIARGLLERRN
ncbi:MAG: acyl-CoA/acyl-ACP dehydrogenase, partial [Alphaproteobacteria bacterium]